MFNLFLILYFLFITPQPAQAYLDPGTGSYITQLLIGFFIGGGYLIKVYWRKIITFIQSLSNRTKKNEEK